MSTTTTYTWTTVTAPVLLDNVEPTGNQTEPAVASSAAGDSYFGIWTSVSDVDGRAIDSDGLPFGNELDATPSGNFHPGSIAGLTNGTFVATFTDGSDHVTAHLFNADGSSYFGNDFAIDDPYSPSTDHLGESHVAALANGAFAVTWTADRGGGNEDIHFAIYEANGARSHDGIVNSNAADTSHSSVAGLSGGQFVTVWEEQPAAGGNSEVRFRLFTPQGSPVNGTDSAGVLIDNVGSVNKDIQVAALHDGGFVVAYTDNGWGSGTDITARIYNADGSARTGFMMVNGGDFSGNQFQPSLAVLSNGDFVVGWRDAATNSEFVQAFDAQGHALGTNSYVMAGVLDADIAGLSDGRLAIVAESSVPDVGGTTSIRSEIIELDRNINGDGGDDVIRGVRDGLPEKMFGNGGDDTFDAGAPAEYFDGGSGFDMVSYLNASVGVHASLAHPATNTGPAAGDTYVSIESLTGTSYDDTLEGDGGDNLLQGYGGHNTLIGGGGNDELFGGDDGTVVYSGARADYQITKVTVGFFEYQIVDTRAGSPDGTDLLASFNTFQFADGAISEKDLFPAPATPPVDPTPTPPAPTVSFDAVGYRAVYEDAAASGLSAQDHYHQIGWHEGHDPAAGFDTTLYLIYNPDVAAAGVDPFEHYLTQGAAEGRTAYQAIGQTVVSGFDAEYYLWHNPDVAAAGVDPLTHFLAYGWHEGRNPNAFFDTNGYLAHYADVAAAGVNPLQHYEQVGWMEGRDPSAGFDTHGYLAANPDVAAAHVNPLDHFITSGIYEGRAAINDGTFH